MYSATTKAIRVTVEPTFLDDQSTPADNHYVWAYQVKIENTGVDTVKLINRCWRITDAMGRIQEVKGRGVVGNSRSLRQVSSLNIRVERHLLHHQEL